MDFEHKSYNIILTGFMGTGKTTIGRLLAEKLTLKFVDTDAHIAEQYGKTIEEIFVEDGERAFRQMERDAARDLGEEVGLVISTGGRMMLDPENITALGSTGHIFCLTAPADEILRRVLNDKSGIDRPLLKGDDPQAKIFTLLEERADKYGRFLQIDTHNRSPEEIRDHIISELG